MATLAQNIIFPVTTSGDITVTDYREYGTNMSNALVTVGLAKTSDNGQVNWNAMTTVPGGDVIRDYEIFRFTDSLQSTAPVYIRLDYMEGQIGVSRLAYMRMSVGTDTDGNGNLRGSRSATTQLVNGSLTFAIGASAQTGAVTGQRNQNTCYFSSDGGRLQMLLFPTFGNISARVFAGSMTSISRLVDPNGTPNGKGVNIVNYTPVVGPTQQLVPNPPLGVYAYPRDPMPTFNTAMPVTGTGSYANTNQPGTFGCFPVYPNIGYADNWDLGVAAAFNADSPPNQASTVPIVAYGGTHTFISSGTTIHNSTVLNPNSGAGVIYWLLRYE